MSSVIDNRSVNRRGEGDRESVSAEIAVAVAGVRPDDYWGMLKAINGVLDRFGIAKMQRPKGEVTHADSF